MKMYSFLSNLYPAKFREKFYIELGYFETRIRKEFILGTLLFFSIGISLSVSFQFSLELLSSLTPILAFAIMFFATLILLNVLVYSVLSIIAINRGRFIENVLPDALELISANLRAGMTIDRALIASNRKEFGYLNYLFNIVGKEVTTGKEIGDSLIGITKKVKSERFARSVELIVMAMKSGGEMSRLLSQVAENLVHQRNIEEKIKAGVTTYLIFIGVAVCFAAPFLYGLSSVFVKIMVSSFAGVEIPPNTNIPFSIDMDPKLAAFLPGFVKQYAALSLGTLGIMSSFLLGMIRKGKAKFGISYIPAMLTFTLLIYYAVSFAANLLFSSIT
jgi:pilus assembly protein TadC